MKARPTLYRGIQMRSRLEADFAGAMDRDGYPAQSDRHTDVWMFQPPGASLPPLIWPGMRQAIRARRKEAAV